MGQEMTDEMSAELRYSEPSHSRLGVIRRRGFLPQFLSITQSCGRREIDRFLERNSVTTEAETG